MKIIFFLIIFNILIFADPLEFRVGEDIRKLDGSESEIIARHFEDNFAFDLYSNKWQITLFNNFSENKSDFLEYESIEFEFENTFFDLQKTEKAKRNEKVYLDGDPNNIAIYDHLRFKSKSDYYLLDFYEYKNNIKYDIQVDAKNLNKLKIGINKNAFINESGDLVIDAKLGKIIQEKPIAFVIENDGSRRQIEMEYVLNENHFFFQTNSEVDQFQTILIDPVIRIESSYYGGLDDDRIYDVDIDAAGNYYMAGITSSSGKIAFNGHQVIKNNLSDAFLVKINNEGERVWATYYGGSEIDIAYGVGVGTDGNVAIVGETASQSDIATSGSHQENIGGGSSDAFIAYFNSDGERLWASYYGGFETDKFNDVSLDNFGNAYVAGFSRSDNNIFSGGFQSQRNGDADGILVKFNPLGERRWGTYYGGSSNDYINSVDLDPDGNIYFCGTTESNSNIAANGHQNSISGDFEAFLVKFDPNGDREWGTYFGGIKADIGNKISVSGEKILLAGSSQSSGIAINGNQLIIGGAYDGFYSLFDSDGEFDHSSYIGGNQNDDIRGCFLTEDAIYLTGYSRSNDNIAVNAFQEFRAAQADAIFAKYSIDGEIIYSSYYGGEGSEFSRSICVVSDTVFVAGYTDSRDSISQNGYQNNLSGQDDGFFIFFEDSGIINDKIDAEFQENYCAGNTYLIDFELIGDFSDSTVITMEISDHLGDFTNVIYSTSGEFSKGNNSLNFTIPSDAIFGTGYKFRLSSTNPKVKSKTVNQSIRIIPIPKIEEPLEQYCENKKYFLWAEIVDGCTYSWKLPDGTIQNNVNRIDIFHNQPGIYEYTLIQEGFGCSEEYKFEIEVIDSPEIELLGDRTVCRGDTAVYVVESETDLTGKDFYWEIEDVELIEGNLFKSQSIKVKVNGDDPSIFVQGGRFIAGCSPTSSIEIEYFENVQANIIGSENTCKNCTEKYFLNIDVADYNWEIEGGEILSGENTNEIEVKWGNSSSGRIVVFFESENGCINGSELFVSLSDNIEIAISPEPSYVCEGEDIIFSTSSATFLENNWEVEGADIISKTENTVEVYFSDKKEAIINLTQINSNTSQTQTKSIAFEVRQKPEVKIAAEDITLCPSIPNSVRFEEIANLKYSVNIQNGSVLNKDEFGFDFQFENTGEAKIRISANIANDGCDSIIEFSYMVSEIPDAPVLQFENKIISSNVPVFFTLNGELLNGEPQLEYTPSENGTYQAYSISEEGCISELSNSIFVSFLSITELAKNIKIFPNPADNILIIELKGAAEIEIIDLNGRIKIKQKILNNSQINISRLETGFYYLKINLKNNIYYTKINKK